MLPIVKEITYTDPAKILRYFADEDWLCFLDSAKKDNELGKFSFIAFNPFLRLVSKHNRIILNHTEIDGDPFFVLQQQLMLYKARTLETLPPFQGGALGYFSYDLLHHLENVPRHKLDVMNLPEMMIGFYDSVISFDHHLKKAWIVAHGFPGVDEDEKKKRAENSCEYILRKIDKKASEKNTFQKKEKIQEKILSNFETQDYRQSIQKVIDYIYAGDIFQANISQCFSTKLAKGIEALDLYFSLRQKNPAPFAAFLQYGEIAIASASPERFIKLDTKNKVETRPIKGTRRRSADPKEDQRLAMELINSEKDRAENTMIVDLLRNDLSRVCTKNSVVVKKLCGLETYATVHHLVSTIEAILKPAYHAIDLLCATFPGGSITGAPKVRAMEIIAELEPTARGPYCGSIGYIGFDGAMDTSIVIRTFTIKGADISFQAGGGIVADSIPADEQQETLTKAAALFKVLIEKEQGNDFAH